MNQNSNKIKLTIVGWWGRRSKGLSMTEVKESHEHESYDWKRQQAHRSHLS